MFQYQKCTISICTALEANPVGGTRRVVNLGGGGLCDGPLVPDVARRDTPPEVQRDLLPGPNTDSRLERQHQREPGEHVGTMVQWVDA